MLPELTAALADPRNWSVALPAEGTPGVTLRSITADPTTIVVQPTGLLRVREIVVPLDQPITKFNNATPADGTEFSITDVRMNQQPAAVTALTEPFAPAQFTSLSDADKVSAPSYEPFDAGVQFGDAPLRGGKDAPRTIQYVTKIIDDYEKVSRVTALYQMPAAVHAALAAARAPSAAATTGLRAFAVDVPGPIAVKGTQYLIASTLDLTPRTDVLAAAATYYEAKVALASFLAAHPEQRDSVQVLAAQEAVTA